MTRKPPFESLAQAEAELRRRAAERDRWGDRLEGHVLALKEPGMREDLLRNSVAGMFRNGWAGRMAGSLIGQAPDGLGWALGAASGKGILLRRAGWMALAFAAPKLLERMNGFSWDDLVRELGVSWGRLKEHWEQRKADRSAN